MPVSTQHPTSALPLARSRLAAIGLAMVIATTGGDMAAAEPIGRIKSVAGTASIQRGSDHLPAAIGMPVEQGDTAVTGDNGTMGLLLADDTTFSVGPGSAVVLDTFVYNPADNASGMVARFTRGSMAFLSGKIARFRPDAVSVVTPTATIGIRGTRFAVDARPGGRRVLMQDYSHPASPFGLPPLRFDADPDASPAATAVLLAEDDGSVGVLQLASRTGSQIIDTDRGAVTVGSADQPPSAVFTMDQAEIDARFGQALAALPPAPLSFELFFDPGTTTLTAESRQRLTRQVLAAVRDRQSDDILLAGHTDRAGPDALNDRLSLARANAVREALLAAGVPDNVISVQNYGETEPAIATDDGVAEPRNRRVEVRIR